MDNEDVQELILYERDLTIKSSKRLDGLRGKFVSLAHKTAPKYYCPEGLLCHVFSPNRNCLYEEGLEEEWSEEFNSWNDELRTYEDTMGFCPRSLYFLCFVAKNLKEGKAYNLEKHLCDDWRMTFIDSEYSLNDLDSTFPYERCIICGKEFLIEDS